MRINKFDPIHVLIMQNSMPNVPETDLHFVFDIKGSSINREVLKRMTEQQLKKMAPTKGKVLKDLDYIRLKQEKKFMQLGQANCNQIKKHLEVDVNFLKSMRFMDYSLLLAIRKVNRKQSVFCKD